LLDGCGRWLPGLGPQPIDGRTSGVFDLLAGTLGLQRGDDAPRVGQEVGRGEHHDDRRVAVERPRHRHALVRLDAELDVGDLAARDAEVDGYDVGRHGGQKVMRACRTSWSLARNCPKTESRGPVSTRYPIRSQRLSRTSQDARGNR